MTGPFWEELRARLAGVSVASGDGGSWRRAAVLVPLYERNGEVFVLLTRRTETVEHHKGQISFPGGAADPEEKLERTALRETFEEMGIVPDDVQLLGRLPDVEVTVSRFRVAPFVGVIPHPYRLQPSADEIEEVISVPLALFRDPASLRVEVWERDGRPYEVYFYDSGGYAIWGATARIIKHLIDLLNG